MHTTTAPDLRRYQDELSERRWTTDADLGIEAGMLVGRMTSRQMHTLLVELAGADPAAVLSASRAVKSWE